MRILLICPFFPPENKIAAVRISKLASFWASAGHEVRVLTRDGADEGLIVPEHAGLTIHRVADPMMKAVSGVQSLKPKKPRPWHRAASVAYAIAMKFVWPDIYGRWAKAAGRHAAAWDWRPDVVVTSVGPFSALMLGSRLAKHFEAKLAVDYRDLLSNSTYYPYGALRRRLDSSVERRHVSDAALLTTVSAPLADELEAAYGVPTVVVTNGYDPQDFAHLEYHPSSSELRIAYCGWVIPKRRDPLPFLSGVAELLRAHPDTRISVDFYGPHSAEVAAAIESLGLDAAVRQHGKVSHAESLQIQADSDALLLLLWNDPGEKGVLSGKVFEYIGAARPIIMTGLEDSAAGDLIRDNGLGVVSNDPAAIADALYAMAEEKSRTGRVQAPSLAEGTQFTRDAQSRVFLDALEAIV
ncbi:MULTISPECIES: glycosyltransferase [unclassified Microbacterium]|uniref:glycosyltransferase n=1 Tax=unclassified Microbacterium TaxID=2609290 RepID=UPI0021A27658|nr:MULTISPECIES: glycosyltransferase [unclassified Microbacterium]MCT1364491.1 glycosyltransferase [Microbacterium sp. p3-SID131]MCT1376396.1 glycosyltransferase [Microbacterium sp. p3-SID337]